MKETITGAVVALMFILFFSLGGCGHHHSFWGHGDKQHGACGHDCRKQCDQHSDKHGDHQGHHKESIKK